MEIQKTPLSDSRRNEDRPSGEVRPREDIGGLTRTDAQGYLVNVCRRDLITPPWLDAVAEIKDELVRRMPDQVHSLYVRGSVAKGTAIAGLSDLDLIVVLEGPRENLDVSWFTTFRHRIDRKYTFQTGLDAELLTRQDLLSARQLSFARFTIKTQSACIHGPDLALELPGFRPGIEAVSQAFSIRKDIEKVTAGLRVISRPELIERGCAWIMKCILRTGFELVMVRENCYTRDLFPCYQAFSRQFPAEQEWMRRALFLALNPTSDRDELSLFLKTHGPWIVSEAERTFAERSLGDVDR